MTDKEIRIEIINKLRETERPGIDDLINHMITSGFFTSPCSGQYHLCKLGGLAEHSLNVLRIATNLKKSMNAEIPSESMIIAALLHDLGKMGQFGKPNYIPNMLKGRGKDAEPYQSTSKPFLTNPDLLYVEHEIRSVMIADQFIDLTEEESFAILNHNGMYGALKYSLQGKETPLQLLIHFADLWASRVTEKESHNEF